MKEAIKLTKRRKNWEREENEKKLTKGGSWCKEERIKGIKKERYEQEEIDEGRKEFSKGRIKLLTEKNT